MTAWRRMLYDRTDTTKTLNYYNRDSWRLSCKCWKLLLCFTYAYLNPLFVLGPLDDSLDEDVWNMDVLRGDLPNLHDLLHLHNRDLPSLAHRWVEVPSCLPRRANKWKLFSYLFIGGLQHSQLLRVPSGLFTSSTLTHIVHNRKHAHYMNIKHTNIIQKLVPSVLLL